MQKLFKRGFTLVELLVVIAIIGILASVVVVNYNSSKAKARDAKRKTDLMTIQSALELYYADNKSYPLNGSSGTQTPVSQIPNIQTYLQQIPTDPKDNTIEYQYTYFATQQGNCQPPFYLLQAQAEQGVTNDTCYTSGDPQKIYVVGGK
ncbi:MAG: prepilin-type N-terminal cleavage/methylation domain-containing protein [Patescibacteria group bacterium]|nr:prepilin-type N-terminal cleavage/methylation domain-containing protein [Patescibacteria group bacterium]